MNYNTSLQVHDPMSMQFFLCVEDMVRRNLGKVSSNGLFLAHKEPEKIENILEGMGSYGFNVVKDGRNVIYLTKNTLCCRANIGVNHTGTLNPVDLRIYSAKGFNEFCMILVGKGFVEYEPPQVDVSKETEIIYAFPGAGGVQFRDRQFSNLYLNDIACNYTPDIIEQTRKLIEYTYQVSHGLVVLSGPVGTGKSYLIRSILTEINRERQAVVCNPATLFLNNVNLLHEAASEYDKSFLVFEDVGDLLTTQAAHDRTDAKSNILNMSEGFLSLLMDTILLVSFNHKLKDIDPAITRPGRCIASIEVGQLPYKQAKTLVDCSIPAKPHSLAEIYEMKRKK